MYTASSETTQVGHIETIVVDPAAIVSGRRTNEQYRHRNDLRFVTLRPPFTQRMLGVLEPAPVGDRQAAVQTQGQRQSQSNRQTANPDTQRPIYIPPKAFIDGVSPPTAEAVYDLAQEMDGVDHRAAISPATLDACWDLRYKTWERQLRDNLRETVTLRPYAVGESQQVSVVYKTEAESDYR